MKRTSRLFSDPRSILTLALLWSLVQIGWAWRFCHGDINFDAISYIGIARHILSGEFIQSVNGYWSPLLSWVIALFGISGIDITTLSHIITIATFFTTLSALYALTLRIWGSHALASFAALWFSAARNLASFSVVFIGADYLLSTLILVYFLLAIDCIDTDKPRSWLLLGVVHGLAFLAKAISLYLLGSMSLVLAVYMHRTEFKKLIGRLSIALLFPFLTTLLWGALMEARYGVFMTGYQFKKNALQWTLRQDTHDAGSLRILTDSRTTLDRFLVLDPLPPGSKHLAAPIPNSGLIRKFAHNALRNIPLALRELMILITPGGMLALLAGLFYLLRARTLSDRLPTIILFITFTGCILIGAYSLLVVDGRYIIPLAPLFIAGAIGFLSQSAHHAPILPDPIRRLCIFLIFSTIGMLYFYRSSHFRLLRDDTQASCRSAARILASHSRPTTRIVTLGTGPYPEQGVGWEAGFYAAYFANVTIAAYHDPLQKGRSNATLDDIAHLDPDAVLVWGAPSDAVIQEYASTLAGKLEPSSDFIHDSDGQPVGRIYFRKESPRHIPET